MSHPSDTLKTWHQSPVSTYVLSIREEGGPYYLLSLLVEAGLPFCLLPYPLSSVREPQHIPNRHTECGRPIGAIMNNNTTRQIAVFLDVDGVINSLNHLYEDGDFHMSAPAKPYQAGNTVYGYPITWVRSSEPFTNQQICTG